MDKIRVLELYSGIGGMHYALKESIPHAEVVAAVDINPVANKVYSHNFPTVKVMDKGIEGFSVKKLDEMGINMVLMSPPCQPFTRVGLQKDVNDPRTKSFLHFLSLLPKLKKLPSILLENVKGFDNSEAHTALRKTLVECGYHYREFLLSPKQLGVPNARLRYYMLARTSKFHQILGNEDKVWETLPTPDAINLGKAQQNQEDSENEKKDVTDSGPKRLKLCNGPVNGSAQPPSGTDSSLMIERFLVDDPADDFMVPEKIRKRYIGVLDIVTADSTNTTCFTKAYTQYAEGTGSVLNLTSSASRSAASLDSKERNSEDYKLRYFTPREVANFLCFPESFSFPDDVTRKQRYRVLGNSLSVKIVAALLDLLVLEDESMVDSSS